MAKIKKLAPDLLHFLALLLLFEVMRDHELEVLIVMFLMYESGYDMPMLDRFSTWNSNLVKWCKKRFTKSNKKPRKVEPNVGTETS